MEIPIYMISALVGAISALVVAFFTEYILQGMRKRRKKRNFARSVFSISRDRFENMGRFYREL